LWVEWFRFLEYLVVSGNIILKANLPGGRKGRKK